MDAVDEFLEHYGKKGMKWGVRRSVQNLSTLAERQTYLSSKDSKWIAKVNANPKLGKMARISARDAKKQIKNLNNEYKQAGYNVNKNGLHQTRYDNEVASILQHSAERAAHKVHGRSGTGLLQVTVHRHPDGSVSAFIGQRSNPKITKQIQKINKHDARVNNEAHQEKQRIFNELGHADESPLTFADFDGLEFHLVVDADGFIEDVITPFDDDELAQSDLMKVVDEFLEHQGVKGMKWGVHRDERALSTADKALNISQRSQVRVASTISALASVGMASNAAATLFQMQSRFEHLRVLKEVQTYAENSPYVNDAGREALRQTRSHIVKGLVGSAIGATAIATAVGIVTRRTAKAYFAPLHKVYGDSRREINSDLKSLSKDIKNGKRPKLTNKQYEAEVSNIVKKHMTADAANVLKPFHELARTQLGTELNTKDLKVSFEKLPNTNLVSKMTVTTPTGLKLVKAIKNVEHAATESTDVDAPDLELFFDYKFDSAGHVIDWSCPTIDIANDLFEGRFDVAEISKKFDPESNLQHDSSVTDFLEHHGVRGMKWGQHRFGRVQSGAGYATGRTKPAGSGKPPWQRPPAVKAKSPQLGGNKKIGKEKKGKQPSADALEIHALRQKVKKHGAASLTNDDLSKIAKRAELQQKYNKAYPKTKSKKQIAAGLAINLALSEFGSTKITGFVGAKKGAEASLKVAEALKTADNLKKLHDAFNKK